VIEVHELSKIYRGKVVVDRLSFAVQPGHVTGFLGPNGAGKSTTMRLIVGLDHPSSGSATIGNRRYADLPRPLRIVGVGRRRHPMTTTLTPTITSWSSTD
jgi:ABC-2 type transport system ATP-binding protein